MEMFLLGFIPPFVLIVATQVWAKRNREKDS